MCGWCLHLTPGCRLNLKQIKFDVLYVVKVRPRADYIFAADLAEKNTSSCLKYLPFMCFFICVYLYLYLEVCGYLTAGVYCEAYARTGGRDLNICEQTAAHSSAWSTLGCIKQMAMEKSQVWAAGCRKLDAFYNYD